MNGYLNDIAKCIDGYQKDYYKECTLVDVLYSKPFNPILIIFGKTVDEICDYERNDTYAYRTLLHYWHSFLIEYPKGIIIITKSYDYNIVDVSLGIIDI